MAKHGKAEKEEYNWLDDPFDEQKQAEDLQAMQSSQRIGCMVAALAVVAVMVAACAIGCAATGLLGV